MQPEIYRDHDHNLPGSGRPTPQETGAGRGGAAGYHGVRGGGGRGGLAALHHICRYIHTYLYAYIYMIYGMEYSLCEVSIAL